MNKAARDYAITVIGILLLGAGLYFVKNISDPQGFIKILPYICIGSGCVIFGHGVGNVVSRKAIHTDPDIEKQVEIEKNDERNIAISNKAKAKAYDLMTYVFFALMIAFALMGIEMAALVILVFVYVFVQGYAIYYRSKFDKEM